jgi:hypothetical protein
VAGFSFLDYTRNSRSLQQTKRLPSAAFSVYIKKYIYFGGDEALSFYQCSLTRSGEWHFRIRLKHAGLSQISPKID